LIENVLLPDSVALCLEAIEIEDQKIILVVRPNRVRAACPECQWVSTRVHSKYLRTASDVPCAGIAVQLRLYIRRFFCDNPACKKGTFTERLPNVVAPFARRTERLTQAQQAIGFIVGGEAGARIAKKLGMPTSPDTLLRLVRSVSDIERSTPRVLGIDDWAICKNTTYGTILVDLEERQPVDLLPDRTTETLVQWLREHPDIEVVARDRAKAYVDAVNQALPNAVQVTDRFHLLQNLRETLEKFLDRHPTALRDARVNSKQTQLTQQGDDLQPDSSLIPGMTKTELARQSVRE
jgi:transposase